MEKRQTCPVPNLIFRNRREQKKKQYDEMIWNRWRNQRNLCVQSSVVWWNCQLSWKHFYLSWALRARMFAWCLSSHHPLSASFRGATAEIYTSITFSCSLFNQITKQENISSKFVAHIFSVPSFERRIEQLHRQIEFHFIYCDMNGLSTALWNHSVGINLHIVKYNHLARVTRHGGTSIMIWHEL